jgi:anthranilate phosphoribosyltransferase
MGPILAGVLAGRNCSALVFHGDDGLDELTTTAPSAVWIVHDGEVSATTVDPADLGIPRSQPADLKGGDPAHNAGVVRAFVGGEQGPVRDTALLNAAAALAADAGVAGPEALVPALADGYRRAGAAIDSGAAARLLDRWIAASQRLAAAAS